MPAKINKATSNEEKKTTGGVKNRVISRAKPSEQIKRNMETRKNVLSAIIENKRPATSAVSVPLKRSKQFPTENDTTKPKQTKVVLTKPAPYDYKAKFQLLQEKHINLKNEYSDMSEKYKCLNEKIEDLLLENIKFRADSDKLKTALEESAVKDRTIADLTLKLSDHEKKICVLDEELNNCKNKFELCEKEKINLDSVLKIKNEELKLFNDKIEKLEYMLTNTEKSKRDMESLLMQQDLNRRQMLNLIQDLKGNIRVFCRIRPPTEDEKEKLLCQINCKNNNTVELNKDIKEVLNSKARNIKQEFMFDRVFTQEASQEEVFLDLKQLVESALDGYNICVFAYGQTGSGKTYTMQGGQTSATLGMIPRTAQSMFELIEMRKQFGWMYKVEASFLEIYNEHIYDLLIDHKNQKDHEIRMVDSKNTDVYVTNLTVKSITSVKDLLNLLKEAHRNRSVAATEINEFSSRSHSVTKITLHAVNHVTKESYAGTLNLVDLAGSERARNSEATRLAETKNINRSLANLGNVILALLQNQEHVPFRNSKLTYLLMPALRGNSKTLMIVNIAPLEENYSESVNSLRFASKVNQCKVGSARKNKLLE